MFIFCNFILTGPQSELYSQTVRAYFNSAAPGTVANRTRQAKVYVYFAVLYSFNPLNPTSLNEAMYVQYLANTYSAINTVKNYLSGARYWVRFHRGDDSSFTSNEVSSVLTYNTKKLTHVQSQAYPLNLNDIKVICRFIDSNPAVPLAFKPAILIGFSCFLRASNLLSPSINSWLGPHTLAVSDIRTDSTSLTVRIRSTKTIISGKPLMFRVYPVINSQ